MWLINITKPPAMQRGANPRLINMALRRVMVLLLLLCSAAPSMAQDAAAKESFERAVVIPVEGTIDPMLQQFLYRKLDVAREQGADLVILQIDSPGGLLIESEAMAARMRDIDWARTVAYIPRQGLSGAAILSLGCDEIVLGPAGKIGDAGAIEFDEFFMFQHAEEKVVSDLAEVVRFLAKTKGRPPALAEAMVDRNVQVYEVTNARTGEKTFMSEEELRSAPDRDDWQKGPLVFESRKDHFLEVTGQRGVELQLASAVVANREELKERFGLKHDPVELTETWSDAAVYYLNKGWITGLLLIIGLGCLWLELSAPGIGIGGLLAGLCFALFFWSRVLGGTAGLLEVVLFLSGVAFIIVEIFVLPGFGLPGIVGAVLLLVSVVMAGQRVVIPQTDYDVRSLLDSLMVMAGSGVGFVTLAVVLRRYFGILPGFRRIVLEPPTTELPDPSAEAEAEAARQALLGQEGTTISALRPAGKARFGDQVLEVAAEGTYIAEHSRVRVIEVTRSRVVVVEA